MTRRKLYAKERRRVKALTVKDYYVGVDWAPEVKAALALDPGARPKPQPPGWDAAKHAEAVALRAAAVFAGEAVLRLGGWYSGTTIRDNVGFVPGGSCCGTSTSKGARYSSRCTFKKTDAEHWVQIGYEAVVGLSQLPPWVIDASAKDGLPLISAGPAKHGMAPVRWVTGGKPLRYQDGWIAWEDGVVFHAKSQKAALQGLRQKIQAAARILAQGVRRATGVAPLFQACVSVDDVRKLTGWCKPGCAQWLRRHMAAGSRKIAHYSDVVAAAQRSADAYGVTLLQLLGAGEPCRSTLWTGIVPEPQVASEIPGYQIT